MKSNIDYENMPKSIGIIMDGNGRWAKKRLMPRSVGHREGVKTLEKILSCAFDLGIEYVTVYAFSTENQGRPKDEIESLFKLIDDYFRKKLPDFIKKQIRVKVIGDKSYFNEDLQAVIANAEENTKHFTKYNFHIALNYGARDEIVKAVNRAVDNKEKVTEDSFANLLFTKDAIDPDILIRTGGEKRLSNFMLYQLAYTELFFLDVLWPDFKKAQLYKVIEDYQKRTRRFGKV